VPFNTSVTSIIDRGGSLDGLRRGLMVEKVRLWLHVEGPTASIPKRMAVVTGQESLRMVSPEKEGLFGVGWRGSGRNHHLLNVK
jgi:hypothetical protein